MPSDVPAGSQSDCLTKLLTSERSPLWMTGRPGLGTSACPSHNKSKVR